VSPLETLSAAVMLAVQLAVPVHPAGIAADRLYFPVRGKTLTLHVFRPAGVPRGTVIMASGDVGWVGLAVGMAKFLSREGYIVVGVNTRRYLAAFRTGKTHLLVTDPPADYLAMAAWLEGQQLLVEPVIVSGVSEGAAIAVLAAASPENHGWLRGAITLGLPPVAELAWRWKDMRSWITKHDPREPSFAPKDVIASVSPLPLVMIQSTTDEYVRQADYEQLEAAARAPKKLVLIDARNHRFTDRRNELRTAYLEALDWVQDPR
jgi:type IV secretory pathway VirJ component